MSLQVSFDFMPPGRVEAEFRAARDLPDGETALIEEGRRALLAYHRATLANDSTAAGAARVRYHAIAVKLNGGSSQGMLVKWGKRDAGLGGAVRLEEVLAAVPGKIPMHGQLGKFILSVSGCRAIISITGGLLHDQYHRSVEVRALDWDRPFISNTGFLSTSMDEPEPGETVKHLALRMIKEEIGTQVNWTNGRRVPRKKGLEKITKGGGHHVAVYYCDDCYDQHNAEVIIFQVGDVWHHQGEEPGSINAFADADHDPCCENGPETQWVEEPAGPPKDDPDCQPGGWIHEFLQKHPTPGAE
jgi:hypothetical protein